MENGAIVAMQSRVVFQEVSDAISSVPETQWKFVVTRTKLVFIEVGIGFEYHFCPPWDLNKSLKIN